MRLSVFALVCLFLTACATREKGRERISFNKEWRFALTEKQANASAPDTDELASRLEHRGGFFSR